MSEGVMSEGGLHEGFYVIEDQLRRSVTSVENSGQEPPPSSVGATPELPKS